MPENNNNNDNLFTQMFGLESEQPNTLPSTEPIQAPITNQTINGQTSAQEIEQRIIKSPAANQVNQVFQNDLANQLNFSASPSEEIVIQTNKASTEKKQDEIIQLNMSTPKRSEEGEVITEEPKFNPNAIPSEPFDYTPPKQSNQYFGEEPLESASPMNVFMKVLLIFIGVAVLIGGWIFVYSTILAPEEEANISNNAEKEEQKEEEPLEEESPAETIKIPFDQTLSFYKGLVDDPNELNQEYPYDPAASTGVIKCELIEPIVDNGITIKFDSYLYYENYLLKKSYLQQMTNIKEKKTFNQNVDAIAQIEQSYTDTESLTIDSKIDYVTQTITLGMFSNLAYGSYNNSFQDGMIYKLKLDYDDSIKSAMATIYGLDGFIGNIKCSSVKTS